MLYFVKNTAGRINGQMFADFICEHFPATFEKSVNPTGMLFLQDGDPSQNSKKAKLAMSDVGATKFSIPARSTDMNPIENLFNHVKATLHKHAIEKRITFEDAQQYAARVKSTLEKTDILYVNKTIETMEGRISSIVQVGGKRIKY